MFLRSLMSLLLIASLAIATMAHSVVKQDETQDQEASLNADEEREARALVEEFIERFEKSEDIKPLVNDFFVSDFTERLRGNMKELFPLSATPEVASQLSSDEILRAYSASTNCIFVGSIHYIEILRKRENERAERGESEDSDGDEELSIEELIPPDVIKLIQSDPTLARMLENEMKHDGETPASQEEILLPDPVTMPGTDASGPSKEPTSLEGMVPFKSVERMRHYTSLLEQGVDLLRDHINSTPKEKRLSVSESWRKLMSDSKNEEADEKIDMINPRLNILTEEFMGYQIGTRLICANALMFHMDMVRASDGQLKIVNVYLQGD